MKKHQNKHHLTPFFDANSKALDSVVVEETKLIATWLFQKTENTRLAYESDLKAFFNHFLGKTMKEITTAHLVVYFKQNPDFSRATIARKKAALSSLFKFMVKKRYLDHNPADSMDPVRVPDQTQYKILDFDAIRRMVQLEEDPKKKFFISLIFKCGLRVSEAINLKRENFRKRSGKYYLILTGKGGFTRTIILEEKYYEQALGFLNERVAGKKVEYLFVGRFGNKPITRKTGWSILKVAAKKAKLSNKVSPHWLRHSHATLALESGDDLRLIQQTLGHKAISTTVKYTQVALDRSSGMGLDL